MSGGAFNIGLGCKTMKANKNLLLLVAGGLLLFLLFGGMQGPAGGGRAQVPFSDFLAQVDSGRVAEVTIQGQEVLGKYDDGTAFRTFAPANADIVKPLTKNEVRVTAAPEPRPSFRGTVVIAPRSSLMMSRRSMDSIRP